jgi:hypothetical protein
MVNGTRSVGKAEAAKVSETSGVQAENLHEMLKRNRRKLIISECSKVNIAGAS